MWRFPDEPGREPTTPVAVRAGDRWGVTGPDADAVSEVIPTAYGLAILLYRRPVRSDREHSRRRMVRGGR